MSRWGRFQDPDQAAHYEFLCREAGVTVRYCAEAFEDDGTLTSSLLKSIKRVMAAEYSRQLFDRCRTSLRRHMLGGGKCGGVAPYGFARQAYDADGTAGRVLGHGERRGMGQTVRLVPGPMAEQEAVRLIFRLFTREGVGCTEIACRLEAEGLPYRHGASWNENRVRGVLTNKIATGVYRFNQSHHRFRTITRNPVDEWIGVRMCAPLVTPAVWRAARTRFAMARTSPWTDEHRLQKLRDLLRVHSHPTRRIIDAAPGAPSVKAYKNHFGSMEAALRQVGYVSPRKPRRRVEASQLRPAEILLQLRALFDRKGYISIRLIEQSPSLPSPHYIRRTFGSLRNALEAAGVRQSQGDRIQAGRRDSRAVNPRPASA